MSQFPVEKRRYSDKELALIIKRAAELEGRVGAEVPGGVHSLAEIQQIAEEAGLDPELILQAAASLELSAPSSKSLILGAPTEFRFQRTIDAEIDESDLGELISTIRQIMGHEGEVSSVLGVAEWKHYTQSEFERALSRSSPRDHVEISPRPGETKIRVTSRYATQAGLVFGAGAAAAGLVSVLAVISGNTGFLSGYTFLLEAGLIAGAWSAAYFGARSYWRRASSLIERRARNLMDQLESQVRAIGRPGPGQSEVESRKALPD